MPKNIVPNQIYKSPFDGSIHTQHKKVVKHNKAIIIVKFMFVIL